MELWRKQDGMNPKDSCVLINLEAFISNSSALKEMELMMLKLDWMWKECLYLVENGRVLPGGVNLAICPGVNNVGKKWFSQQVYFALMNQIKRQWHEGRRKYSTTRMNIPKWWHQRTDGSRDQKSQKKTVGRYKKIWKGDRRLWESEGSDPRACEASSHASLPAKSPAAHRSMQLQLWKWKIRIAEGRASACNQIHAMSHMDSHVTKLCLAYSVNLQWAGWGSYLGAVNWNETTPNHKPVQYCPQLKLQCLKGQGCLVPRGRPCLAASPITSLHSVGSEFGKLAWLTRWKPPVEDLCSTYWRRHSHQRRECMKSWRILTKNAVRVSWLVDGYTEPRELPACLRNLFLVWMSNTSENEQAYNGIPPGLEFWVHLSVPCIIPRREMERKDMPIFSSAMVYYCLDSLMFEGFLQPEMETGQRHNL